MSKSGKSSELGKTLRTFRSCSHCPVKSLTKRSDLGSVEAKLSVEPAETLRVEAVDDGTGKPLPGLKLLVFLNLAACPLEHTIETDATGTAVIGRLPRGPVELRKVGHSTDTDKKTSVTLPHPDTVRIVGKAPRLLHVRLSRSWRAAGEPGEWFDRSFAIFVRDAKGEPVDIVSNVVEGAALVVPSGQYHVDVAAFDPDALFGPALAGVDVTVGDDSVTAVDF